MKSGAAKSDKIQKLFDLLDQIDNKPVDNDTFQLAAEIVQLSSDLKYADLQTKATSGGFEGATLLYAFISAGNYHPVVFMPILPTVVTNIQFDDLLAIQRDSSLLHVLAQYDDENPIPAKIIKPEFANIITAQDLTLMAVDNNPRSRVLSILGYTFCEVGSLPPVFLDILHRVLDQLTVDDLQMTSDKLDDCFTSFMGGWQDLPQIPGFVDRWLATLPELGRDMDAKTLDEIFPQDTVWTNKIRKLIRSRNIYFDAVDLFKQSPETADLAALEQKAQKAQDAGYHFAMKHFKQVTLRAQKAPNAPITPGYQASTLRTVAPANITDTVIPAAAKRLRHE